MKKALSIFLAIVILCSSFAGLQITAAAELPASGKCGENVTYTFDASTGELTISGTGRMNDYSYYSNPSPFSNQPSIKSIIIEDGVTNIGNDAFYKCENLIDLKIGNDIAFIGSDAFGSCISLEKVKIPDCVKIIYDYAFEDCQSIHEIIVGNGLKKLDSGVFENCKSLKDISLPVGLTIIGDYCFEGCNSLNSITIPSSVNKIGFLVFNKCSSLTGVSVSNNDYYYSIDGVLFRTNDHSLICYPCSKQEPNYIVPAGTTHIFKIENCPYLKSITLPISLESLYISKCVNLSDIYFVGSEKAYNGIDKNDDYYDISLLANIHYYCYCQTGHSYTTKTAIITKPTATTIGYTVYTCEYCGENIVGTYTSPTGKLTLKCKARTKQAQTVIWNNVGTASGYQVQISTKDGKKWSTYATLKAGVTSYTFKNLAAGNNYKFRVRFFIKTTEGNKFSPWSATLNSPTLPAGTSISKIAGAKKAFTAQWKKQANATGYQIEYSTKANFSGSKKVTLKSVKTLKTTVKKLSAKKVYYVRIRTYKTIGKTNYFSTWSSAVKVKTK
ncbi:MAG: leucine-rich repeat protein [Clostridia bacterium]|nr:leucine-rich repeat protein [Clostridia bacterium]